MIDRIAIDKLCLSDAKAEGFVPKPSPSLKRRVEAHGVVDPIIVRPLGDTGRFEILSNPETWVAAGQVGLHQVPVLIRDDLDAEEAAAIVKDHYGVTSNNPIDEAETFLEQLDRYGGRDQRGAITKLSTLIGRPRPYIAHSLRLLDLPEDIQDLIRCGNLSAGQARPLIAIGDRRAQQRLADVIVNQKMTARECELLVKGHRTATPKTSPTNIPLTPSKDPNTRRFEQRVSDLIGCKFELDEGRAVIDYGGNLEVLQGVVERLGYREN